MQIKPKQKYGLVALFSTAVIIMIFEIARTVLTIHLQSGAAKNIYDLLIFTVLEVDLAVIISALMVYRTLLGSRQKRNAGYGNLSHPKPVPPHTTTGEFANVGSEHELHDSTVSSESFGSRESSFANEGNANVTPVMRALV